MSVRVALEGESVCGSTRSYTERAGAPRGDVEEKRVRTRRGEGAVVCGPDAVCVGRLVDQRRTRRKLDLFDDRVVVRAEGRRRIELRREVHRALYVRADLMLLVVVFVSTVYRSVRIGRRELVIDPHDERQAILHQVEIVLGLRIEQDRIIDDVCD